MPERFAEERFVHLTLGLDRLLVPANAYYCDDRRRYVALAVDLAVRASDGSFVGWGPPEPP